MLSRNSETLDSSENDRDDETGGLNRAKRAVSPLTSSGRIRSITLLSGVALLVRAARTASRNRGRAAAQGLLGTALLGVALRRNRSDGDDPAVSGGEPSEAGKSVSDDATAARGRRDVMNRSETNPRGVSEGETATEADEGDVQFTTDGDEPRSKPDLEGDTPTDPRYNGSDETAEIGLSEASLADEASEATGPAPEQSQPTQTEDTEPESSPPADSSHVQADVPDGNDADDESDDEGEHAT